MQASIKSLYSDNILLISNKNSSDIQFATAHPDGVYGDMGLVRLGHNSIFNRGKDKNCVQEILLQMLQKSQDGDAFDYRSKASLKNSTPVTMYTTGTDNPDVLVSVLRIPDGEVGLQTCPLTFARQGLLDALPIVMVPSFKGREDLMLKLYLEFEKNLYGTMGLDVRKTRTTLKTAGQPDAFLKKLEY